MFACRKFLVSLAVSLFVAGMTVPLAAQQSRLEELDAQVTSLFRQGKYNEAAKAAQEKVRLAEATFGPENVNLAALLNNLAQFYHLQGKYTEAEPLYKRALAIRERVLGPNHADVAAI